MPRLLPVGIAVCCALVVACDLGSPGPAHVRMANLVPDAPAVDFCLKSQTDSAFSTPFVGGSGLAFPSLSGRVNIDAGTYSVRLVQAPATNCNTVLNGLADFNGVQFGEDGAFTVAAMGRLTGAGQPTVAVNPYLDDTSAPSGGVKLRYVHAAPGVDAVDIGTLSGNPPSFFSPLTQNLGFGGVSNPAYVPYANGVVGAVFAAVAPPGSGNVIVSSGNNGVTIPIGTVSTLWLVGQPNVVGNAQLSFLLSADNANSFTRYP